MLTRFCAVLVVAAVAAGPAAHAVPLDGTQFAASGGSATAQWTFSPNPFTVGPGVDMTADLFGIYGFAFDFSDSGLLTGTYTGSSSRFGTTHVPFVFAVLTPTLPAIAGFAFIEAVNVVNFGQANLTFTENSLAIAFAGETIWMPNASFTAQISFAPVPLPATLPLLAAGLAGLALLRRRRLS